MLSHQLLRQWITNDSRSMRQLSRDAGIDVSIISRYMDESPKSNRNNMRSDKYFALISALGVRLTKPGGKKPLRRKPLDDETLRAWIDDDPRGYFQFAVDAGIDSKAFIRYSRDSTGHIYATYAMNILNALGVKHEPPTSETSTS